MNDLKMIANLMKMATETVLHSKYKDIKNIENFTCRVGTGSATNVTSSYVNRLRQTGIKHVLTYGLKMLESKQTKKLAMVWTTGTEIASRGYFGGNPSFKDLIVSVILHEYAHVIQTQEEGLKKTSARRSIHGDFFYSILDGFYEKGHHIELDKYLSAFPAYQNAQFLNEDRSFTKLDLIGAEYCRINSEKFKNLLLKIDKLNPKTILGTQENGRGFKAYYTSVDKVYTKASDLPEGAGTFTKPTFNKGSLPKTPLKSTFSSKYSALELRKRNARYVSIIRKGTKEFFKIEKLNPKRVAGIEVISGSMCTIPYEMINEDYTELPTSVRAKYSKPSTSKPSYSALELHKRGAKYISILNRGIVETFKIEKLNPKRVSGIDIVSGDSYTIPYEIIKNDYVELPKDLMANEEVMKSKELEREVRKNKEPKYSKQNLQKDQIIETKIKGVLKKFKVLKLNPSRLKGEMVGSSGVIYNIPYGNILKAY